MRNFAKGGCGLHRAPAPSLAVVTGVALAAGAIGLLSALPTAHAHPHVFVDTKAIVLFENGTVTGLAHEWTFDEFYTKMAIEGLDKNNDGTYDREELAELAQVNIDGLKEFDYFTFPRLGDKPLALAEAKDYWLEYTNGALTLHVTTPFSQPVLAEAEGLTFAVYDPSYFIAFNMPATDAIRLTGAPAGCKAEMEVPKEDAELAKRLAEALQVDVTGTVDNTLASAVAKTVRISCPKP